MVRKVPFFYTVFDTSKGVLQFGIPIAVRQQCIAQESLKISISVSVTFVFFFSMV